MITKFRKNKKFIIGIFLFLLLICFVSTINNYPPFTCFTYSTNCIQAGLNLPTTENIFDISKISLDQTTPSSNFVSYLTLYAKNPKIKSNLYLKILDSNTGKIQSYPASENYRFIYNKSYINKNYNIIDISSDNSLKRSLFLVKDKKITLLGNYDDQGIGPIVGDDNNYYVSVLGDLNKNPGLNVSINKFDLITNKVTGTISVDGINDNLQLISGKLYISYLDNKTQKTVVGIYENEKFVNKIELGDDFGESYTFETIDHNLVIVGTKSSQTTIFKIENYVPQVLFSTKDVSRSVLMSGDNIYLLDSQSILQFVSFSISTKKITRVETLPEYGNADYSGMTLINGDAYIFSDSVVIKCNAVECNQVNFQGIYQNGGLVPLIEIY